MKLLLLFSSLCIAGGTWNNGHGSCSRCSALYGTAVLQLKLSSVWCDVLFNGTVLLKCISTLTRKFYSLPSTYVSMHMRRCMLWEWCWTFRRKLSVVIFNGLRRLDLPPKRPKPITYPRRVTTQKNNNSDLSTVNFWWLVRITWSVCLCNCTWDHHDPAFIQPPSQSVRVIHATKFTLYKRNASAVWHFKIKEGWRHRTRNLFFMSREDIC
jgi:hypothetical protein